MNDVHRYFLSLKKHHKNPIFRLFSFIASYSHWTDTKQIEFKSLYEALKESRVIDKRQWDSVSVIIYVKMHGLDDIKDE